MNEREIIATAARILHAPPPPKGPGDDCAVLDTNKGQILLAVDQLIAGVHYSEKETSPAEIAAKLLKRNISDIAAMGGSPAHALVAMALADGKNPEWHRKFFESLAKTAEYYEMDVRGGDVASNPGGNDTFSLTIIGHPPPRGPVPRNKAKKNDALFATGAFGRSFTTKHHMNFLPRVKEGAFLANGFANAMIDVSDGLLIDATRIADASNLSLNIQTESIPRRDNATTEEALNDGEDYELLAAVPEEMTEKLLEKWPFETPLTRIGRFNEKSTNQENEKTTPRGFIHFK